MKYIAQIDERIAQLQEVKAQYAAHLGRLEELTPTLVKNLRSVGLEQHPGNWFVCKTGMDREVWADGDHLRVELNVLVAPTFKFFNFQGYNRDGSGKATKAAQAKAQKMEAKIVAGLVGCTCSVNEQSLILRDRDANTTKKVLVTVWVKL